VAAVAGLVYWWVRLGGCYKVVSQEERDARKAEIEEEMGETGVAEPKEEPQAESTV
jgi:hypothetical protein